jgi:tagaturonate reductase
MKLDKHWLAATYADQMVDGGYPERVIQFGEGVFMRGFVDWIIHQLNKRTQYRGRVVAVKPLPGNAQKVTQFNQQDGLYTVWLRGVQDGQLINRKEVVTSVHRMLNPYEDWQAVLACARQPGIDIVVSNTTESGLTYTPEPYLPGAAPASFPAKLTAYLYERYVALDGDRNMGMDIVPCELVEDNGNKLREMVLRHAHDWRLPDDFVAWMTQHNYFYNTLVDSIVTKVSDEDADAIVKEFSYEDAFAVVREPFHLWVIAGAERLMQKWDFHASGLNVKHVEDVTPYRLIKVRILNGAHTALAALAHMSGRKTVKETVDDPILGEFVRRLIHNEILPTLTKYNIPAADSLEFAVSVQERFANPYLKHEVLALQLNALSKIRVRLLPTLRDAVSLMGQVPPLLAMALAGQLLFYGGGVAQTGDAETRDNPTLVTALRASWAVEHESGLAAAVHHMLSLVDVWGEDLTSVDGLEAAIVHDIEQMRKVGVLEALSERLSKEAENTFKE